MENTAKYGKIALVTTAIFFISTPHRFQSREHAEDQICKLLQIPGPRIEDGLLGKVTSLARQVDMANKRFLATKLLDRAAIFHIFTANARHSLEHGNLTDLDPISLWRSTGFESLEAVPNPVTPFPRYTHSIGHSLEYAGRYRMGRTDHSGVMRAEVLNDVWFQWASKLMTTAGFSMFRTRFIILWQSSCFHVSYKCPLLDATAPDTASGSGASNQGT
jgi:hypothetical protein